MANKYFKNRGNVIKSRNFKPNAPGGKPSKSTGPDPLKLANPRKKIETKTETKKKVYEDKILRDSKRKEKMFGAPEKVLKNKSKQSFGEAFKAAKKAGVKEFDYNGKKYAAVTEDEVKKAGFKDGKKDLGKYLNTKLGNKAR